MVVPVIAFLYAAMALASVSIFLLETYPSDLHLDPSWHLVWLPCWKAARCSYNIYKKKKRNRNTPYNNLFMSEWLIVYNKDNLLAFNDCTTVFTAFVNKGTLSTWSWKFFFYLVVVYNCQQVFTKVILACWTVFHAKVHVCPCAFDWW